MGHVEKQKLEWTLPVKKAKTENTEQGSKEDQSTHIPTRTARFNFRGQIVTPEMEKDESSWSKALHNHGEEMERPGYTIEELFTLARSEFAQQRAFGFNTIAEIFKRSHDGNTDIQSSSFI
jgi:hypothetical protein